ncbi:MAG TPA: sigma-70 family RNA polymerase sigma factor [Kofleriaceae bacterium]|nr:sigma-70 family RNA polymerase sigma factor [Kofleriaceae bacterium]
MSVSAAGRAAFGELGVADADVERLAAPLADAQRAAHAAEIYLAAGCIARAPAALAALERGYIARVPEVVAGKRLPPDAIDELCQTVRERLLAGDPPYLARAVGRGSLAGLVAVIANRAALDWLRARARSVARAEPEPEADQLVATGDPARDHLRRATSAALKAAFEAAVAALPARERTLLRLHLVDGLTIDDVARMYDVHRATAARQIERAREAIAAATRERLAASLPDAELGEIGALIASQLDLSLSRVLR